METIRIATRKSALALWQAHWIGDLLRSRFPSLAVEFVLLNTQGDLIQDVSLAKIGGKGLFLKELEAALLEGRADIAVHSLKDCPVQDTPGLTLAAFLPRATPWDAFVSASFTSLQSLPPGARVGTSSLRRQSQIKALRSDVNTLLLRGNVDTRVKKLLSGEYDAIILAACGLERLNLQEHIRGLFSASEMLPAIGQGIVTVQCSESSPFLSQVQSLHDPITHAQAVAERRFGLKLGSSCDIPIGGYAQANGNELILEGFVGSLDGAQMLRAQARRPLHDAVVLGDEVAEALIAQGALEVIRKCQA